MVELKESSRRRCLEECMENWREREGGEKGYINIRGGWREKEGEKWKMQSRNRRRARRVSLKRWNHLIN